MSMINNISRMNSMRITGLVSGLDVDALVQKMLANQQSRLNKANQQKTLLNWQKDAYRSVVTTMNDFQKKFLDILSPTSINKSGNFKSTVATVPSSMSQYFSATATSDAVNSSVTVNSIKQLATSQSIKTIDKVGNDAFKISGNITFKISDDVNTIKAALGKSISFTVNGETKNITLANKDEYFNADNTVNTANIIGDLNAQLKDAFGTKVDANGNNTTDAKISIDAATGEFNIGSNNTVQITGSSAVQSAFGFTNKASNYVDTEKTIAEVFAGVTPSASGKFEFKINDVEFKFDGTAKIKDVMNEINKSAAGVSISYSSLTDKFTMTAKATGSGNNIRLSETDGSNLLSKMFGKAVNDGTIGNNTNGQNAVLTVNNVEIVRNSNTVTVDGVTLNLLQATPTDFDNKEAVSVKIDAQPIVDLVKNFVNEYNALSQTLANLTSEKREKNSGSYYLPLTDAQRESMNEKDIATWEEMGKKGLLKSDPTITKILSSMRTALNSMVSGTNGNMSLASIGIKTPSYSEDMAGALSGKLVIDEEKLKQAIENNPDAVMNLFTQQSAIKKDAKMDDVYSKDTNGRYYTTDANGINKYVTQSDLNALRNSSMGLAQRMSDIFFANINVSVDPALRGTLISKAGTGGSLAIVDKESSFDKRIAEMDKTIAKIQAKLYAAETKYYNKFSALETAMAKMNEQMSALGLNNTQQ